MRAGKTLGFTSDSLRKWQCQELFSQNTKQNMQNQSNHGTKLLSILSWKPAAMAISYILHNTRKRIIDRI